MSRCLLSARAALLALAAGVLLTANSCLPQDYFATLAGEVVSQTVSELLARTIAAVVDAGIPA